MNKNNKYIHTYKQINLFTYFFVIAGISKDRASRMAKYYALNATARTEHRGGARKVAENESKKQVVMDHIQTFTCRASHYGRRGAPGRKYLPVTSV